MAEGAMSRLLCGLIVAACVLCASPLSLAQPATAPTSAPAAATPEAAVESAVRAALPQLLEASTGVAAVEKLAALRDAKVLLAFQRISNATAYSWKELIVYIPDIFTKDANGVEVGNIYDLFAPLDEAGNVIADPLGTIPRGDIGSFTFTPPRPVRIAINNTLRVLGLKVNDVGTRRSAAKDLGNRRQVDALTDLREVAQNDENARVRHDAAESIALIVASGADTTATPAQKVDAIKSLGELQCIRALDLLREILDRKDTPADEAAACRASMTQIERHKSLTEWIKHLFSGLSAGSIFVLLALGLAITFGLMGVINMAHGEMMMIGAITTWACFEFISPKLPAAYFNWYYVIAFPASFLVAALVGLIIELSIVRHLYKRPLDSMLATIGVSYILIQAVRLWKGDNLGMRGPSWAGGNLEIIQDVVLPYNRLFLIALTIFCIVSVILLFRYTRIGLLIRATVQNREMAQALGVNTRLVDMFTFAFGAGLAGLAGYGIVLTSNPTPEMGQTFIVKSFLTVVVGGVGKLIGVIVSGLGLGFVEKILEPIVLIEKPLRIFDATWAQVAALLVVVLFMQRKPAGLFPEKGRMADQADRTAAPIQTKITPFGDLVLGGVFVFLGLIVVPLLYLTGLMSPEYVNKLGYIIAFAICAIGLDLIWGYIGVLSLCQFLFFSIGGYCMGLYLINYGPKAPDGIPMALSYVMSDVSGRSAPWFLSLFTSFPVAVFLGALLPGLIAALIGLTTFRSRVKGVYFAILTQAITVAFWLIFQKNDLKLGGTNGLTNFTHILGFSIQPAPNSHPLAQTRFWLYVASFVTLMLVILFAKLLTKSGFGRVLLAIRDDETRLRFGGYQTWAYKATAFVIAAMFAGIGGMLYVPQKGIITPHQIAAGASILVVAWVAVGGRGSLWGPVIGTIFVSLVYESLTSGAPDWYSRFCNWIELFDSWWLPDGTWLAFLWSPESWLMVLGALFVLVPLLFPGGLISIPGVLRKKFTVVRPAFPAAPIESNVAEGSTP